MNCWRWQTDCWGKGKPKPGISKKMNVNNSVLVIGGGIAGITSALELGNSNHDVYLIEREATVGGQAASFCCKATEVCTKCSVCLVPQKLREVKTHPKISILTNSIVSEVRGKAGNFQVEVWQRPQYILPERCIACGICFDTCPTEPKAICSPSPQAVPYSYTIDESQCLRLKGEECNLCREICPTNAINFERKPERQELNVGTIIVATGFDVFDAREVSSLGYGRYPNVLTGLDLERTFNRENSLKLPSNGKEPHNIAFVQCVGSRNENHCYCSQVCCKYAMRFARLIKHQNPDCQVTIFYIDLQTAGKGFAEFYEECKESIRFIRGIPVETSEAPSGELEIRFENILQGKVSRESFDLVILSVGIAPRKDAWELARILGINLDDDGFFDTKERPNPIETNVDGIFLAGACQGPRDIPSSIAHGASAAERVMEALERWQ
jgi:heterodisulfide reductase subunit A